MVQVDFNEIGEGEYIRSKFEKNAEELTSKLEDCRNRGDNRIHCHQLDAVFSTRDLLQRDDNTLETIKPAVIVAPTGAGKSGMIVLLPYILAAKKVLIITPGSVIAEQIARAFGKYRKHKSFFETSGIITKEKTLNRILEKVDMVEKSSDITERFSNLVIVKVHKFGGTSKTTLSLEYQRKEVVDDAKRFFAEFDVLIVDEAHHYPAETWKNIVNTFTIPAAGLQKKIIFLTATPYRGSVGSVTPILDDLKSRIAFRTTTTALEDEGLLRRTEFIEKDDTDSLAEDIKEILDDQHTLEPRFRAQAMIVVHKKEEALEVEEKLKQLGSDYAPIAIVRDEGRGRDHVNKLQEDFTAGKYRIAVICRLLREGYDNANVTLCVILKNGKSKVDFTQFIGRCMRIKRGIEGDPDKTAGIVLSYKKFEQSVMWENREAMAEEDPTEEEF